MDLEFTPDQLELRDNARAVLAAECPPALVRAVFDDGEDGQRLWATLVDLGWPAIGVAEERGGLGLSFVEVGLVVEELGRVVAPSPFLATITQFAPLVRGTDFEARIADGVITGAAAFDDGLVLGAASADEIAVVEGDRVYVVPAAAATVAPIAVLDPTMPLALSPSTRRRSRPTASSAASTSSGRWAKPSPPWRCRRFPRVGASSRDPRVRQAARAVRQADRLVPGA